MELLLLYDIISKHTCNDHQNLPLYIVSILSYLGHYKRDITNHENCHFHFHWNFPCEPLSCGPLIKLHLGIRLLWPHAPHLTGDEYHHDSSNLKTYPQCIGLLPLLQWLTKFHGRVMKPFWSYHPTEGLGETCAVFISIVVSSPFYPATTNHHLLVYLFTVEEYVDS